MRGGRRPRRHPRPLRVYADALGNGHTVTPCIFEVFGGFDSATVELLNRWAAKARGKTPPEVEPPWCARNFVPYWSQVLSKTVQRGAAEEILYRVREVGEARAAAHGGCAYCKRARPL